MKSTGIVRKVDQLGRIVIPKELRKTLGVLEGKDSMEIYIENSNIFLVKFNEDGDSSGVVRGVDQLGRIVLPIELRRILEIEEERDSLEIFTEENKIVLKKYEPSCVFCENIRGVFSFKGRNICPACLEELKKLR